MSDRAKTMRDYWAVMDGTQKEFAAVEELFNKTFHPEIEVQTPKGTQTFSQWKESTQVWLQKGAKVNVLKTEAEGTNHLNYEIEIFVGDGEKMTAKAKGTFKDGKLVKVEPVDGAVYDKLLDEGKK